MKNGCQKILNLNVVTKFVCVCACVRACVRMFKCVCVRGRLQEKYIIFL